MRPFHLREYELQANAQNVKDCNYRKLHIMQKVVNCCLFGLMFAALFMASCSIEPSLAETKTSEQTYQKCELDAPSELYGSESKDVGQSNIKVVPFAEQAKAIRYLDGKNIQLLRASSDLDIFPLSRNKPIYLLKACALGRHSNLNEENFDNFFAREPIHVSQISGPEILMLGHRIYGRLSLLETPTPVAILVQYSHPLETIYHTVMVAE